MQGIRELLRGSLASSLRMLPEEDRLAAALPVVCGTALAAHCSVDRLDERGTLHLRVDGSHWLRSLMTMRDVLQRDLSRTSGVALHDVQVEPLHRRAEPRVRPEPRNMDEPAGSVVGTADRGSTHRTFRKRGLA